MKDQIENFFNNIEYIKGGQRVNIIYLTTACNLRCDYCYELKGRESLMLQKTLHIDEIKKFLSNVMEREKGRISTLVIMGGEPLLEPKLLKDTMNFIRSTDHKWGISIVTNAAFSKINDAPFMKEILEQTKNVHITLEVSYDGSGQDRRKFRAGQSSRRIVEDNLKLLRKNDIPYRVSYTVHKDNYKKLLYDMVYILEKLKPTGIKLSIACQELSDEDVDYKKFKQDFLEYAERLYVSYGVPICDLSCAQCNMCDSSNFVGNTYLSPTTGVTYQDAETEKLFDGF